MYVNGPFPCFLCVLCVLLFKTKLNTHKLATHGGGKPRRSLVGAEATFIKFGYRPPPALAGRCEPRSLCPILTAGQVVTLETFAPIGSPRITPVRRLCSSASARCS